MNAEERLFKCWRMTGCWGKKLQLKEKEALRRAAILISFCVIFPFIRDFFCCFLKHPWGVGALKKYLGGSFIKGPRVLLRRPSLFALSLSLFLSSKYFSEAADYILTTFPSLKKAGQVAREKQAIVKRGSDSYSEDCGEDNPKIWEN